MQYWQRRRQQRLYKQWTEHAELPHKVTSTPEENAGVDPGVEMDPGVEEERRFYRFRVGVWDAVGKILRVRQS